VANAEHVKLISCGADATWNWRGGRLDLRDADLSGLRLRGARLEQADLRGARLVGTDLTGTRLQEANLAGSQLIRATLDDVRLGGGSLAGALLCAASLRRAMLVRTDLTCANLAGADLEAANLSHARLAGAIFDQTKLVDVELDGVLGLEKVVHDGPSELGTHALLRYGHQMPTEFLRGVGLSDSFIRYLPSIISSARPVDYFSVYVCAAQQDAELARRLHNDLQNAGVRCWCRHVGPAGGESDGTLRLHDQSIIVWSRHGVSSSAVMADVRTARQPDRKPAIFVLADDASEPAPTHAGHDGGPQFDFRGWRDFRQYVAAFDSLVRFLVDR